MAEETEPETTEESTEAIKEKKPKVSVKWECPKCGQAIVLHFKAKYPPTCGSKKHSTTGVVVMEQKK
jgi:rubrerythrin